jgi:hypothetical protein
MVQRGWRCLELGAGAGSIVRSLAGGSLSGGTVSGGRRPRRGTHYGRCSKGVSFTPRQDAEARYYEISAIGTVTPALEVLVDTKAWCPRRDSQGGSGQPVRNRSGAGCAALGNPIAPRRYGCGNGRTAAHPRLPVSPPLAYPNCRVVAPSLRSLKRPLLRQPSEARPAGNGPKGAATVDSLVGIVEVDSFWRVDATQASHHEAVSGT